MKLLMTGATGYIGQRMVATARGRGHHVATLGRKRPGDPTVEWLFFELSDPCEVKLPPGLDAIVHLAVATPTMGISEETEITAARLLLAAARRAHVPFLFVSSQTAREDAPTSYGRIKWQIERLVLAQQGWVVRPGQVYGGNEAGLFGLLTRIVRRLPILPAFVPSPRVQPIHVDDLVFALLACVESRPESAIFHVAEAEPVTFTAFLSSIADGRVRRRRFFVPVPTLLIKGIVHMLGERRSRQLGLERLMSLFALPVMVTAGDLNRLALKPRPLLSGMARSGSSRRRWLIEEARAFLEYVLREKPTTDLVRRYVRAVEQLRAYGALNLPPWALRHPALLSLLEGGALFHPTLRSELAWRSNAAVTLAEASPQGGRRFLRLVDRPVGGLVLALCVSWALLGEAASRLARLLVIPLIVAAKGTRGERK